MRSHLITMDGIHYEDSAMPKFIAWIFRPPVGGDTIIYLRGYQVGVTMFRVVPSGGYHYFNFKKGWGTKRGVPLFWFWKGYQVGLPLFGFWMGGTNYQSEGIIIILISSVWAIIWKILVASQWGPPPPNQGEIFWREKKICPYVRDTDFYFFF